VTCALSFETVSFFLNINFRKCSKHVTAFNLSIQRVIIKGNVLWTEKHFKCMSIEFKDPVVLYMLRTYDTLTEYRGWFTMDLLMYQVRNRI